MLDEKVVFFKKIALKSEIRLIALLILLILIIFWRLTFLQAIPGEEDNFTFNLPYKAVFADFLNKGSFPFWSPYVAFGFPQYAQAITATFYLPDLLLFRFLPLIPAFNYSLLFHLIIIAAFTFLFARSLNISPYGSLLAAISFTFCGWILGLLGAIQNFYPLVWLPIALWLIELYFQKKKLTCLVLTALMLAQSVLASFPQITLYVIFASSLYFVWRLIFLKETTRLKLAKLLNLLAILALAAGISAVWLFPLLEVMNFSPRAAGVSLTYAQQGSFNPLFLIFTIYPNLLLGKYGIIGRYICLYVGILPLFFAFFSFKKERNNFIPAFFVFLLLFSFLFSLGKYNPFYSLFLKIPPFGYFRQSWRILFLFEFSLTILAGFGFDNFSAKSKFKNLFFVFSLLTLAFVPFIIFPTKPFLSNVFKESKVNLVLSSLSLDFLLLPAFILFLSATLIFLYQKRVLTIDSFKKLALLLVVFDLFLFGWQGRAFHFFSLKKYRQYYKNSAGANFLKKDRGVYRIYSVPVPHEETSAKELYSSKENFWKDIMYLLLTSNNMLFKVQSIEQSDFALGLRNTIKINELIEGEKAEGHQYDPDTVKRVEKLSRLLGFLNVKYILTKEPLNSPNFKLVRDGEYKIYQNLDFMPRVLVVNSFSQVSEPIVPDLKGFHTDLRLSKYLEFNSQNQKLKAVILQYKPTEITIGVKSEKKGYLLLSDAYYPGWEASVNGEKTKIYLSDYVFRAVRIPAGESIVKFSFEPESFRKGLIISLTSIFFWAIWLFIDLGKKD